MTRSQNGTEKDSQEGLKMESIRQKRTRKAKMTLRKTFEGDFKKMERPKEKQNRWIHIEKGIAALPLMDRCKEKRRRNVIDRRENLCYELYIYPLKYISMCIIYLILLTLNWIDIGYLYS